MRAIELYELLASKIKLDPKLWWEGYGTFWIVIDSILGQNTKYENAKKSRQNLQNEGVKSLEDITKISTEHLALLIKPSGFYNTKAKRLKELCKAICADFSSFEEFRDEVSPSWLLSQKGLGCESVYSVLCYACGRPCVVYDKYTSILLGYFGYEFEDYEEARSWCEGVMSEYKGELDESLLCAHFHALVVEFCKAHLKGRVFDDEARQILDLLK